MNNMLIERVASAVEKSIATVTESLRRILLTRRSLYLLGLLFPLLSPQAALANTVEVASPNGQIVVSVSDEKLSELDEEFVRYWVSFRGNPVINPSKLGLTFKEVDDLGKGFHISGSERASANTTWEQPWGERRLVKDVHNELRVDFSGPGKQAKRHAKRPHRNAPSSSFSVRFRVFDDGIGFRYEVRKQPSLNNHIEILDEHTEFFVDGRSQTTAWWIPSRAIGNSQDEQLTRTTPLTQIDYAYTPLTARLPNGTHISIHEAALVNYCGMSLALWDVAKLKAHLEGQYDGVKVKTEAPFKSP
ncbi:MAG TPA: glycoside hydrolase family 97 N-terminal domain-containing protein, partial [Chthoniobacterales bacterium]